MIKLSKEQMKLIITKQTNPATYERLIQIKYQMLKQSAINNEWFKFDKIAIDHMQNIKRYHNMHLNKINNDIKKWKEEQHD